YSEGQIAKLAINQIREMILSGQSAGQQPSLFNIMHDLIEVQASPNPDVALLLAFLKHIVPEVHSSESITVNDQPAVVIETLSDNIAEAPVIKLENLDPLEENAHEEPSSTPAGGKNEIWDKLLSTIKANHNTLYGIIRMAEPQFAANRLTLE